MAKIFVKGIRTFPKKPNAPSWVIGDLIIDVNAFIHWLKEEGRAYLTDYNGNAQLRLKMTIGRDGNTIIEVNTYGLMISEGPVEEQTVTVTQRTPVQTAPQAAKTTQKKNRIVPEEENPDIPF